MAKENNKLPLRSATRNQYSGKDVIIDSSTGEILGERLKYRTVAIKTTFVTMYLDDENVYSLMGGLGNQGKVLAYILKDYNDKTGMFYFSSTCKDLMVSSIKLSIGTIRSSVKQLSDSGVLLHVGGSEYMINPHLFYKGHQSNYDAQKAAFDGLKSISEIKKAEASMQDKIVK